MKSKIVTILKYLIGWPLSILALIFIGKIIFSHGTTVYANLHAINGLFLCAGIICFLAYFFFRAFFWQKLLEQINHSVQLRETIYLWSISEIKRFIPGNIWSLFGRANAFSKKEISKKQTAHLMLFEAEFLVFGSMIAALPSGSFIFYQLLLPAMQALQAGPGFPYKNIVFYGVIILVLLAVFVFLLSSSFPKPFTYMFPPFGFSQNLSLFFIALLYFSFFGIGTYFTILAVQFLDPRYVPELAGFFVFSFFIGYVSLVTPMGLGVREAVMIAGLVKFMPVTIAGFAAIFARIILIISELIFLLLSSIWYQTDK